MAPPADDAEDQFRGLLDAHGMPITDPDTEEALIGHLFYRPAALIDIEAATGTTNHAGLFSITLLRRVFETMERGIQGADMGFTLPGVIEALGLKGSDPLQDGETVGKYLARIIANSSVTYDAAEAIEHLTLCAERSSRTADDDIPAFQEPFRSKFGAKMWADQNDPADTPYEYLVEDLIPVNEGVVIMGESGTGKSFLTQHLALCGARAAPFFGRRILKPFGTIWCAYEAARGQTARMRAYRAHYDLPIEPLPFAVLTRPIALWPNPEAATQLIAEMKQIVATQFNGAPLGMIVFDTYNASTPGASEIDSEVVSKIRAQFDRFRVDLGCSTIIVGHTNAVGKHRGNEQLTNNIDTVIAVSRKMKAINAREQVPIKDEDGNAVRMMKVRKQREGQDGEEHDFVLHIVEDGTKNAFGRPRTSCVVGDPVYTDADDGIPTDGKRKVADGVGVKVPTQTKIFFECILKAVEDRGEISPPELGLPRSIGKVVDYEHVKRLMFNQMLDDRKGEDVDVAKLREAGRKAIERARLTLMDHKLIGVHSPFVWITGKPVRGVKMPNQSAPDLFDPNAEFPDDEDFR